MDLNVVAQDLFDELKSRYARLTLGDAEAMTTTDPSQARFFKFSYNDHPVSVAIDEENLRLVYNKDLADSLEEEDQQSWYDFARSMREFAVTHNLGFKPQDIEKLDLEQGDFEFLSQVNTVQESKMHGTTKTSYRPLDKTKMIIRHSKTVDESVPGARSRNIQAVFIENNQGERFKFPFNYLHGARAMQMHVAKGGNPYDALGEAICNKVTEIAKMRKFISYAKRNGMVDESTESYIDAANIKIHSAKKLLSQLQNAKAYETAVEELEQNIEENTQETVDNLVKTFTKETFDESLVDAFKILPLQELKPGDDEEEVDIFKQATSGTRYSAYVDKWVSDPNSKLILKKDDSYDALQNNLRSQQKETDLKLMTILRDIATRFLSANPEDDAVVNFASDVETQIAQSGELFAKPDADLKRLKGIAIKLANKYLQDMKRIKTDDAYKDEVRKSPEDVKAFKNIKGQDVEKGKLAKYYKRKYKGEGIEELENWMDAKIAEMHNNLNPDNLSDFEAKTQALDDIENNKWTEADPELKAELEKRRDRLNTTREDKDQPAVIFGVENEGPGLSASIFNNGNPEIEIDPEEAETPEQMAALLMKHGVTYDTHNFLHSSSVDFPEDENWSSEIGMPDDYIQAVLGILKKKSKVNSEEVGNSSSELEDIKKLSGI